MKHTIIVLMSNGACLQLPGLLSLSTKFLPTVMNLLRKLAEEGQAPAAANNPQRNASVQSKSFLSGANDYGDMSSSGSSEVTNMENGNEYSSPSQ